MKRLTNLRIIISVAVILLISGCVSTKDTPAGSPSQMQTIMPMPSNSVSDSPVPNDAPTFEVNEDGEIILPRVTADMFQLGPMDAALFDGALDQATRFYGNVGGITIPNVGVYGQYEKDEKVYVICDVVYNRYYADADTDYFTGMGTKSTYGRAILVKNEDGTYTCETFDLVGDSGDGINDNPLIEFCGPLVELPEKIINCTADCTKTFPADLINQYCIQIGYKTW